MIADDGEHIFRIIGWVDYFGGLIERHPKFWITLGDLESKFLKDEIAETGIKQPIYICGLPRSGTTLLLEILSRHSGVVSHKYSDFPFVYTPHWWNWLLTRMRTREDRPTERAHRDGMSVTSESPEAIEEMLWMAFFRDIHDPQKNHVLDKNTKNSPFETFYRNHLKKLLFSRKGNRYLAKDNYNTSRMEYILKLFPDSKFVIPVRHPVDHIASLIKVHKLFTKGCEQNPKAVDHLRRIGHFEFGPDLRLINVREDETEQIINLFAQKQSVRAWARYWSMIYGYIADTLKAKQELKNAATVIRYEDFCESPGEGLKALQDHCRLSGNHANTSELLGEIKPPAHYKTNFSKADLSIIEKETQETAKQFQY